MPGMKVLEFAFDGDKPSDYQPHAYPRNAVCYTGTHDNDPVLGWWETLTDEDRRAAAAYLGLHEEEGVAWGLIRGGMSSVADLFVAQLQDYLEMGAEARMNTPGKPEGNWCWRVEEDALTEELAERIHTMTMRYGRCPYEAPRATEEDPETVQPEELA